MRRERLKELLTRFASLNIVVVGDLFLDHWFEVDRNLDEPSLETGLTAYQVVRKRPAAGAAGTVMNNLTALGVGSVRAVALLGNDGDGFEVQKALHARGVNTDGIVTDDSVVTPAYNKTLFVRDGMPPQETNRLDVKNRRVTPLRIQDKLIENLLAAAEGADAVMLLDQLMEENFGVVTDRMLQAVRTLAKDRPDLLIYGDSRGFIHKFTDMVIKCNNHEALGLTGSPDEETFDRDSVFGAMDQIRMRTGRPVFITCNRHGVAAEWEGTKTLVPAVQQNGPIDICGAGDACSAGIVSALAAGATHIEAAQMGNLAAGVTVRMLGQTGAAEAQKVLALFDEQHTLFESV